MSQKILLLVTLIACTFSKNFAQVADFELNDYPLSFDGTVLKNAWVGGLNNPQFSQADFNFDGVLDLYIFDRLGGVSHVFLNIDGEYIYSQRHSKNFPPLVNFALLRDYNNDGIMDLFSYHILQGVPGMQIYKGSRNDNDELVFELLDYNAGTYPIINYRDNFDSIENIYVAITDIPVIEDVNGDGDLDILSFDPEGGYVRYYQNVRIDSAFGADTLAFHLVDFCWGKFYESESNDAISLSSDPNSCAFGLNTQIEARHPGSTILTIDNKTTGLKDLVLSDITLQNVKYLKNTGNLNKAWMTDQLLHFPPNEPVDINVFPASFKVDLNNDGNSEIIFSPNGFGVVENYDVAWLYSNDGSDGLERYDLVEKDFMVNTMLDLGTSTIPAIADVNNDGLLDIVIGVESKYDPATPTLENTYLALLLNVGTETEPEFELVDTDWLGLSEFSTTSKSLAPTFGDLDGDGDIDLLIGEINGYLYYLENVAGPDKPMEFAHPVFRAFDIQTGSFAVPVIFDINGDGLNDILIGERLGRMTYFKNIGSIGEPQFIGSQSSMPNELPFAGIDVRNPNSGPNFSAPTLINSDNQTYLMSGTMTGEIKVYQRGSQYNSYNLISERMGGIRVGNNSALAFADLNSNGFHDVVVGNGRGGITIFETNFKSEISSVNFRDLKKLNFNVQPNPANNLVNLTWDLQTAGASVQCKILSLEGQEFREINDLNLAGKLEIDVTDLPAGVYLISLQSAELFGTQKLIIVR